MNKKEPFDQPDLAIRSQSERFFEKACELAEAAGLRPHEAEYLMDLCQDQSTYPTYAELRDETAGLTGPGIRVQCIGYSEDHPREAIDPRPIYATKIGRREGKSAYFEGVQHGNERIGANTARTMRNLAIRYPSFFLRMGFDNVITSDHGEPDSMHLQGNCNGPMTLADLPAQYRGNTEDQHSWSFPSESMQYIRGNTAATLRIIRENDLAFFGALHGAHGGSEVNLSHAAPGEAAFYKQLFYALGMNIAPLILATTQKPFGPGVNKEFTQKNDVSVGLMESTTVCDHLNGTTKYINPDITCFVSAASPDDPYTDQTLADIVHERTSAAVAIIEDMAGYLEDPSLKEWLANNAGDPEVGRLHRAAHWWATATPPVFRSISKAIEKSPKGAKLRQSEADTAWPYPLTNTAIYVGNIASLGARAGLPDIQAAALGDARMAIDNLPALQPLPIGHQIATQAIALIAAMNYARQ